jgi:hypothetical protein
LTQLNFEDKGGLLPVEKEATVYDLMTSRACIFRESCNPVGDEYLIAPTRGSKNRAVFSSTIIGASTRRVSYLKRKQG